MTPRDATTLALAAIVFAVLGLVALLIGG